MLMTHVQFVMERKLSYHVATSHGLVWSCTDHAYATETNRHPALRHLQVKFTTQVQSLYATCELRFD